mmetsp:Transcript_39219/g.92334  ORF Transcript_39219/g.92334 Transcript_39219/m.92334 type:complete len:365 (-) Transcript_39219:44-1138(-)
MTSLTVELGLRRKRGNDPEIPEQLASRQDVTLAQKQRLAMLAKMGLGPAGGSLPQRLAVADDSEPRAMPASGTASSTLDRRRALLERERKARELEEMAHEEEERLERERRAKQARGSLGIQKLGPVMARKEEIPQFLPSPAQVSTPAASSSESKLQVNISRATLERVKAAAVPAEADAEDDDDADDAAPEDKKLDEASQQKKRAAADEAQRQKAKKKKAKRHGREDDDRDERRRQDDEAVDDDEDSDERSRDAEKKAAAAAGAGSRSMVVDSVKGKVSNANRNFTDADLERRFQEREREASASSLMTEEEVLKMIRKEKTEKGAAGSAARRIQRDLAEWAATKEQARQRVKSPHRFERMVVSRK